MIAERTAKREAMMKAHKDNKTKPTKDERFAMKTKMLDEQIASESKNEKHIIARAICKMGKDERTITVEKNLRVNTIRKGI